MERKLAAILAADIAGYSRMMGVDEEGTLNTLRSHREAVDELVAAHRGRIFNSAGDSIVAEFPSAVEAITCAVEIQQKIAECSVPLSKDKRLLFRMGLNIGDVMVDGSNLFGDGVNVAARLQALAEPGGICVARNVYNQVKNKVAFALEFLGEHRVKNIAEPVSVYRVLTESTAARPLPLKWLAHMRGRWPVAATLSLMLLLTAVGLVWNRHYLRESACILPLPDKPSIAVLPFDNLVVDPKWARLGDGITEGVITDLSRSDGLFVVAGNSTRTYKGSDVDVQQVGCDLGVKYVLKASIQDLGDKIRVTPQLIEAANRRLVWSEPFDRTEKDVFSLQDDVTTKLAGRLLGYDGDLPEEERSKLQRKPPTDNLEAYDDYLRAETLGRGWSGTADEARVLYLKAIKLDPNFADAYAGYARVASDAWIYQNYLDAPTPVARKEAYEMASRALALDPNNPRPYSILSALQSADGRHDQAIESARKAISFQPNNAEAYTYLAGALTYAGRHVEALAAMETALRMDPKPSPQFRADLGWVLFHNGQYERALEQLEKARDGGVTYLETLAAVYVKLDRLAQAQSTVREILKIDDRESLEYYRVLYSYYQRDDLDRLLDALRAAGMPEWPYGFQGRPENRLSGKEITNLTLGQTWVGEDSLNRPFVQEITANGTLAYRDTSTISTGSVTVEGNKLCQQNGAFLMGRKYCGYVYRNPGGTPKAKDEYIYASAYAIYRFSITP